jgi:hypothetical protein
MDCFARRLSSVGALMEKETDSVMEELQIIKERCSLARLARTPEEQRRHSEDVMRRVEVAIGRSIETADFSK